MLEIGDIIKETGITGYEKFFLILKILPETKTFSKDSWYHLMALDIKNNAILHSWLTPKDPICIIRKLLC